MSARAKSRALFARSNHGLAHGLDDRRQVARAARFMHFGQVGSMGAHLPGAGSMPEPPTGGALMQWSGRSRTMGNSAPPRVLLVEHDEGVLRVLEQLLRRHGGYELHSTMDARQVLPRFRELHPDLVILDLHMPGLDGFAVIQQLRVRVPDREFLPIVVFSGDMTTESRQKALALGATDYLTKPFEMPEIHLRVRNLLQLRELTGRLEDEVRAQRRELEESEVELASRLALVAELVDYGDGQHVQRVGRTASILAGRLGLADETARLIRHAAPLHDIGKTAIPDHILLKRDELSLEEWDLMKTHTTIGARMLTGSRSPILQMAEEIALYHHENWNGTGYTPGLAGEDIPLVARIVTVSDVFDALTHTRPHKPAWTTERSAEWIQSMRDSKFDARVVDALLDALMIEDLAALPRPSFGPDLPADLPLPQLDPFRAAREY
jgi:putative two-component system response regulator